MKKIQNRQTAFSLAEALITLLIVCLITLASVPIVTKKKRALIDSASGVWMCSKIVVNENGSDVEKYVEYNSVNANGENINDPTTWKVLDGATSCKFVPPKNVKNFVVTAIGGGGGGHDGQSEKNMLIENVNGNGYYAPTKDGTYYLALIGGGGGGAGSDDGETGGAGGSGAFWFGSVDLKAGVTYMTKFGKGGEPKNDGESRAGRGAWAGNSTFGIPGTDDEELIIAGGARGGRATGKDILGDVYGGQGGDGGSLKISDSANLLIKPTALTCADGTNGEKMSTNPTPGISVPEFFWGADMGYTLGTGGAGKKGSGKGVAGTDGFTALWEIVQNPGSGGKAGAYESRTIPHIKSVLIATIGSGGDANSPGEDTKADVYDVAGENVLKTIIAKGGEAGVIITNASIDNNLKSAFGTPGEDSNWNQSAGGQVGQCKGIEINSEVTSEPCTKISYDENDEPKCKVQYKDCGRCNKIYPGGTTQVEKFTCKLTKNTYPSGFCIGYVYDETLPSYTLAVYEYTYREALKNLVELNPEDSLEYNDIFKMLNDNVLYGAIIDKNGNGSSNCYMLNQNCIEYCASYETYGDTCISAAGSESEPEIQNSANGTVFGAGGGGGCAVNKLGRYGKGGKGAPGLVVVEW